MRDYIKVTCFSCQGNKKGVLIANGNVRFWGRGLYKHPCHWPQDQRSDLEPHPTIPPQAACPPCVFARMAIDPARSPTTVPSDSDKAARPLARS